MAQPPSIPATNATLGKRARSVDTDTSSKRACSDEYHNLGSDESVYPPRNTTPYMVSPSFLDFEDSPEPVVASIGSAPAVYPDRRYRQAVLQMNGQEPPTTNMCHHPPSVRLAMPSLENGQHPSPPLFGNLGHFSQRKPPPYTAQSTQSQRQLPSPSVPLIHKPKQASLQPNRGTISLGEGSPVTYPIDLDGNTSSPWSGSSVAYDNYFHIVTPSSVTASRNTPSCSPKQGTQHPVVGEKRPLDMPEEEDQKQAAAKKARIDRTEVDLVLYENNKDAIESLWKAGRKDPKARWFEKLYAWKDTVKRPAQRPNPRKPKVEQPDRNRRIAPAQLPNNLTRTSDMTSPVEIVYIRQRWESSKPGEQKHPMNKVLVPDYPQEDTIENSRLRSNGNYSCRHINREFNCCKNGLSRAQKQTSIYKGLISWKREVERLIEQGDLHIAHKTWNQWHDANIRDKTGVAAQRRNRIDALLQPVQGPHQNLLAPASQGTVHLNQQQARHPVKRASLASALPIPSVEESNKVRRLSARPHRPSVMPAGTMQRPVSSGSDIARSTYQVSAPTTVPNDTAFSPWVGLPPPVNVIQPAQSISQKLVATEQKSDSTGPPTKNVVQVTPKPIPNPEFRIRQHAMEAIQRQIGMNSTARARNKEAEGVTIGGIDLSKEPISQDLPGVMKRVICALRLTAVEAAKASPKPEVLASVEVSKAAFNKEPETIETPLWDLFDCLPGETWEQLCAYPLEDDLFLSTASNTGMHTSTETDDKMTLAEEHEWILKQHGAPAAVLEASTSFEEFQHAMGTFDAWESEGYKLFP
ncbi:uncharacterized protein K460DRAFT_435680 [Cucurbitaria berberidis CBS 394.84]|uniref:Uncharacterized protein n=1 Tax=Cucurbitaria berberidis CBS 394.84 TaxID=1168544 RepID=A0A9P4L5R7_9PLEO|nr:uncharacterized protein K460DRAFT_435680 [Cucurbitaria berberidis CBS 394.84]KAF1842288.1 hypothetical protein K460DRAFT_435680 [Cucurbitaria berberidis CBS 394.84]